MTPFDSPLFFSLVLTSIAGVVVGAFVSACWTLPRWLME